MWPTIFALAGMALGSPLVVRFIEYFVDHRKQRATQEKQVLKHELKAEVFDADVTGQVRIAQISDQALLRSELWERIEALEKARDEDREEYEQRAENLQKQIAENSRRAAEAELRASTAEVRIAKAEERAATAELRAAEAEARATEADGRAKAIYQEFRAYQLKSQPPPTTNLP